MEPLSKLGLLSCRATSRSGCGNGRGFSRTPFTMEKIAVLAPIPSASVTMATMVKPRLFHNTRAPKRISLHNISNKGRLERSRYFSFVCCMPPSFINARRRASCGSRPDRRLSSICIWRWASNSSANSRLPCSVRNKPTQRSSHARRRLMKPPNGRCSDRRAFFLLVSNKKVAEFLLDDNRRVAKERTSPITPECSSVGRSLVVSAQGEDGVEAAEGKGVREAGFNLLGARGVGHEIEIADGIGPAVVHRRRNDAVGQSEGGGSCFDGSGRAQGMGVHGFGGADG